MDTQFNPFKESIYNSNDSIAVKNKPIKDTTKIEDKPLTGNSETNHKVNVSKEGKANTIQPFITTVKPADNLMDLVSGNIPKATNDKTLSEIDFVMRNKNDILKLAFFIKNNNPQAYEKLAPFLEQLNRKDYDFNGKDFNTIKRGISNTLEITKETLVNNPNNQISSLLNKFNNSSDIKDIATSVKSDKTYNQVASVTNESANLLKENKALDPIVFEHKNQILDLINIVRKENSKDNTEEDFANRNKSIIALENVLKSGNSELVGRSREGFAKLIQEAKKFSKGIEDPKVAQKVNDLLKKMDNSEVVRANSAYATAANDVAASRAALRSKTNEMIDEAIKSFPHLATELNELRTKYSQYANTNIKQLIFAQFIKETIEGLNKVPPADVASRLTKMKNAMAQIDQALENYKDNKDGEALKKEMKRILGENRDIFGTTGKSSAANSNESFNLEERILSMLEKPTAVNRRNKPDEPPTTGNNNASDNSNSNYSGNNNNVTNNTTTPTANNNKPQTDDRTELDILLEEDLNTPSLVPNEDKKTENSDKPSKPSTIDRLITYYTNLKPEENRTNIERFRNSKLNKLIHEFDQLNKKDTDLSRRLFEAYDILKNEEEKYNNNVKEALNELKNVMPDIKKDTKEETTNKIHDDKRKEIDKLAKKAQESLDKMNSEKFDDNHLVSSGVKLLSNMREIIVELDLGLRAIKNKTEGKVKIDFEHLKEVKEAEKRKIKAEKMLKKLELELKASKEVKQSEVSSSSKKEALKGSIKDIMLFLQELSSMKPSFGIDLN
ncbi:MAG: hypothetical protein U0457_08145 [Candidatus Sericytochromatia bacterium]